ncbi:MAG: TolC family protein [Gemmataceae bacterium]
MRRIALLSLALIAVAMPTAFGQEKNPAIKKKDIGDIKLSLAPSLVSTEGNPITLDAALRLAGVQNPEIRIARERVLEALALRQLAAAQFLPSLNAGASVDHHVGTLQNSNGNILNVHRDSLYVGLGSSAVSSGTVAIPGIVWNLNLTDVAFRSLASRQRVAQAEFASQAVRNEMLLRVAAAYLDLLRAEGRRAIAMKIREDAGEVARITSNYAKTGQGRLADAHRAATEFEQRNNEVTQAENDLQLASARLCQLLNLDPSTRLAPAEEQMIPQALIPDPIPLCELLAIAITQRPELRERQAAIQAAMIDLRGAKILPFSPNLLVGFSAGTFGGGATGAPNQPRFGSFGERNDFDAVAFWTLRNLGVGNLAQIRLAQSGLRQEQFRELEVLNRVRSEVASAHARAQARIAQMDTAEKAIKLSQQAFQEDLARTKNNLGLPIEVLDSLRLLGRSRNTYFDAIVDYNAPSSNCTSRSVSLPPLNSRVRCRTRRRFPHPNRHPSNLGRTQGVAPCCRFADGLCTSCALSRHAELSSPTKCRSVGPRSDSWKFPMLPRSNFRRLAWHWLRRRNNASVWRKR